MKQHWIKRQWGIGLTMVVLVYLAASWTVFIGCPPIHALPGVSAEAIAAVTDYCDDNDYIWKYHWGIPGAVFWAEPFTHREWRTRKIVVTRESDTLIRAECRGLAAWFELKGGGWQISRTSGPIF